MHAARRFGLNASPRAYLVLLAAFGCDRNDAPDWYPHEIVDEPRLFAPGVISTQESREFGVTFTPDAGTVYFTRRVPGERQKIWTSQFTDAGWTHPHVADFSVDIDETPWVTPDGTRMYFASRRPGVFETPDRSDNVWVMDRQGDDWGQPQPLPGEVNRPRPDGARWPVGSELNPVLGPDGALYYWTREAGDGANSDIYRAEPAVEGFSAGRPMGPPINTPGTESHMAFGPDGMMIFQAYGRDGEFGYEDLYIAWPEDGAWSDPLLLPAPINSDANEGFPSFTPDGRFMFFASDRDADEGAWSIWFVDVAAMRARLP